MTTNITHDLESPAVESEEQNDTGKSWVSVTCMVLAVICLAAAGATAFFLWRRHSRRYIPLAKQFSDAGSLSHAESLYLIKEFNRRYSYVGQPKGTLWSARKPAEMTELVEDAVALVKRIPEDNTDKPLIMRRIENAEKEEKLHAWDRKIVQRLKRDGKVHPRDTAPMKHEDIDPEVRRWGDESMVISSALAVLDLDPSYQDLLKRAKEATKPKKRKGKVTPQE